MRHKTLFAALVTVAIAAAPALADVTLPRDVRVYLKTLEPLVGKGDQVQVGQRVRCRVWRDVIVDGHVLIAEGAPAVASVESLKKRKVAGIKGKITLAALDVEATDGQTVQLTGGYYKEGKGRIALSASLSALVAWPLIFIPGAPASLPAGTVFDSYSAQSYRIATRAGESSRAVVDLSAYDAGAAAISAELLYDRLEGRKKPREFEFRVRAPQDAPERFVVDRVNGEQTDPIELRILSLERGPDEATLEVAAPIKALAGQFRKGINTIEIAYTDEGGERVATEVIIEIQI